jgi:hypothetical protein
MTSLHIEHHSPPEVKRPTFTIDKPLNPRMPESYTLLQNMNQNFCCGVIGKPGSGKTSFVTSLFASRKIFRQVFTLVLVYMPAHSLSSMRESTCPWARLPQEQVFGELNPDTLARGWSMIQENKASHPTAQSLVIFDDVQSSYRDCERTMLDWASNRRHYHLSMFLVGQSYVKLPRQLRMSLSDLFLFRVSKADLEQIECELYQDGKQAWNKIVHAYGRSTEAHPFLYLHVTTQRVFIMWNEVITR